MFLEQIEKNKKYSFEHLVERQKQNKATVVVNGNIFSYTTKKGLTKRFVGFNSFGEYKKSKLYPNKAEQVNGFYFVETKSWFVPVEAKHITNIISSSNEKEKGILLWTKIKLL